MSTVTQRGFLLADGFDGGLPRVLAVQAGTVGHPADTDEHELFSYTLNANTLHPTYPKIIRAHLVGAFNSTPADDKTVRVYWGATKLYEYGPDPTESAAWVLDVTVAGTSTAQTAIVSLRITKAGAVVFALDYPVAGLAEDGATPLALRCTAQSGVAFANNTVCFVGLVEGLDSIV